MKKQICKESQPYIQKAYDTGNISAANKRSLHSVGATTNGNLKNNHQLRPLLVGKEAQRA